MHIEQMFEDRVSHFAAKEKLELISDTVVSERSHGILFVKTFKDLEVMMLYNPKSKVVNMTWAVWNPTSKQSGLGKTLTEAYSDMVK